MKFKINVTQRDLDSKFKGNICTTCPVARAVRRHKLLANTIIGFNICRINPYNHVYLPKIATDFIQNFGYSHADRTNVKPFSFILEVPDAPTR